MPKSNNQSWLIYSLPPPRRLLIAAAAMMIAAWVGVGTIMNKKSLLPSSNVRTDIHEIYIAAAKEVCGPGLTDTLLGQDLEACVKKLPTNSQDLTPAFSKITIPTLPEILNGAQPKFVELLKAQAPVLASKLIENRQPYILGVWIEPEHFSMRAASETYDSLIFSQIDSALICVQGSCRTPRDKIAYGAESVPLLVDVKPTHAEPVWAFGKPSVPWVFVISLADGVFVAPNTSLLTALRYYPAYLNFDRVQYAMLFSGVFLLALCVAWLWPHFNDFVAFALLSSALAGAGIFVAFRTLLALVMAPEQRFQLDGIVLGTCFASFVGFAYGTIRYSLNRVLKLMAVWLCFFYVTCLIVGVGLRIGGTVWNVDHIDIVFGVFSFVVPPLICYIGAMKFYFEYRRCIRQSAPLSEKLTAHHRGIQQFTFGILLNLLSAQFAVNSFNLVIGKNAPASFSIASSIALILLFIGLCHPLLSRLSLVLRLHPHASEATRLRLLLPNSEFQIWKAQPRSGVFLELDLKGSSAASVTLKQSMLSIMRALKHSVAEDLKSDNLEILMSKSMGDAIIFILATDVNGIPDKAAHIFNLLQRRLDHYVAVVQGLQCLYLGSDMRHLSQDEKLGLHPRIYIVSNFWLKGSPHPEAESGMAEEDHDDLDFASDDINHQMKYLGKSPPGTVAMCGPISVLSEINLKPGVNSAQVALQPLAEIMGAGAPAQAVQDVRAKKLYYGNFPIHLDRAHSKAS